MSAGPGPIMIGPAGPHMCGPEGSAHVPSPGARVRAPEHNQLRPRTTLRSCAAELKPTTK